MESPDVSQDPPPKRQKLFPSIETSASVQVSSALPSANADEHQMQVEQALPMDDVEDVPISEKVQPSQDLGKLRESEVGITEYVSAGTLRFTGILKKRYTDFLVNEILPSGEVLHLEDFGVPPKVQKTEAPKKSEPVHPDSGAPAVGKADVNEVNHARNEVRDPDQNRGTGDSNEEVKAHSFQLSSDDTAALSSFLSQETLQSILDLSQKVHQAPNNVKWKTLGTVTLPAITDREQRTSIHKSIRHIFSSRLESSTDDNGMIVVSAAPLRGKQGRDNTRQEKGRGRPGGNELGGEYLHFTLYKENKDSMEVMSFLARQLKLPSNNFQFAGTKDRRGVTVQRASAHRVFAKRLAGLNGTLRGAKLGGFLYQPSGLALGDLAGNEFVITLRDCSFPGINNISSPEGHKQASERVAEAIQQINEKGFINYYGLQRFGAFSARTDVIGVKMLQGDLEGACQDILYYNSTILAAAEHPSSESLISSDDKARAKALHIFRTTGKTDSALRDMPRKFSAETALIRHLGGSGRSRDFQGALQKISRNLRLMYVHAYQSLVWNYCAGERWKRYRDKIIEGDLVLATGREEETGHEEVDENMDGNEPIVEHETEDQTSKFIHPFQRARRLSKEEAESGKYSIFDIVLPTPGFDIVYPGNSMEGFYEDFMGSERGGGLDPYDMRRKWRDVSLSGSYRNFLARPLGDGATFEVRGYKEDDEQMVETDLGKLQKERRSDRQARSIEANGETKPGNDHASGEVVDKIAVILKLQLGTSQYATMVLRELMGPGGVRVYKPDYAGSR
ncbi:MAG: hypothetical protein M1816_005978 [Peltula sp. TS41687]|nr:MAG: hypothetical protein M1816_005978 [Peltula sp. TS41687]